MSSPKNILVEIIRYLTINGPKRLEDLSKLFHLKEERILMHIYKGINEGYLGKIGYDSELIFCSKCKI